MSPAKQIRIGTLGTVATFAGEATSSMRELYPEFSEAVYFSSMDACWQELKRGTVDAVILGAERTGSTTISLSSTARAYAAAWSWPLPASAGPALPVRSTSAVRRE
ncbi:MAG: hypothetical protein EXR29_06045 [Betaproteobacteria bacterium]|nr:hypothetical protein [Betaproteobacteria bacterium]